METETARLKRQVAELKTANAAMEAVARARGDVLLLGPILVKRLKAIENDHGDFEIQALAKDGVRAIASGGQWASPDDIVNELRQDPAFSALFAGSDTKAKSATFTKGGTITRADFDALPPAERMAAVQKGVTVV